MGGFSAKFTGLRELDEKLTQLGGKQAEKIIREGLEAGGEIFRAAVVERCHVRPDMPSKTALMIGALKQDIQLKFGRDPDGLPAAIVQPGKYTAHVARWVEYGHRMIRGGWSRLIKAGRNAGKRRGPGHEVGNIQAYPFIRPAYEASRAAATETAIKTIGQGVEKAAKLK